MGLLELIDKDESFDYISIKEAISFLTEKTNSTIQEVAIYLLNKEVPKELACHTKGSDYKIKETSGQHFSYGMFRPYGINWASKYLTNISKSPNCATWDEINTCNESWDDWGIPLNSGNVALLEKTYWYRKAFFNSEHIKSLNLFEECSNGEYFITSDNLTTLLNENNFNGFNDNFKNTDTNQVNQNHNTNSSIERLKKENEILKTELSEKEQKIKELELIQTSTADESKLGSTRAENNVSKLILILATMADIDISKPYANYDSLKTQAELLGIDRFPSDENVASWLKKANVQNPN